MNITLTADKSVVEKARKVARGMGLSVNELVRRYLRQIAAESEPGENFAELNKLLTQHGGHSGGGRFDRNEIHERTGLSRHEHPRIRR